MSKIFKKEKKDNSKEKTLPKTNVDNSSLVSLVSSSIITLLTGTKLKKKKEE